MKFYFILFSSVSLCLFANCKTNKPLSPISTIEPQIWVVESATKVINDDDPFNLKSSGINAILSEQIRGYRYEVSDRFIIKDRSMKILANAKILIKGDNYYKIEDEEGKTGNVKYSISVDGQYCTFIYPDGSAIITQKLK